MRSHEYNNTYLPLSITGTYGHAVDGILGSVLPAIVPILGLRFDLVTCASARVPQSHFFYALFDVSAVSTVSAPRVLIALSF